MKRNQLMLLGVLMATGFHVSAREWKNIDESKTFNADFVGLRQTTAEMTLSSGKTVNIEISKLSLADQEWLAVAAKVLKASKSSVGFKIVLSTKEGDRLARLALDANKIQRGSDPYKSDFVILEGSSPKVADFGVTETKVYTLFWAGTKSVTISSDERTELSSDLWNDWYRLYSSKTTVLAVYHLSLESAVGAYIARQKRVQSNVNEKDE